MSLTDREIQNLLDLIPRAADLENIKKEQKDLDALESSIHDWTNLLVPIASGAQTLFDNKRIKHDGPALQVLDANGGERTVFLPGASKGNKFYIVINSSS